MSVSNIDRDTALRIALAARTMPDVDLATLIGVLNDRLGPPLDLEKLSRITVTDLKTGIGSLDGEEDGEDFGGRTGLEPIKLAVVGGGGVPTPTTNETFSPVSVGAARVSSLHPGGLIGLF